MQSQNLRENIKQAVAREKCEQNHLFFSRYFFKPREGAKFIVNWHHVLICDTVQRVIDGELKNVVINVPPGSSKTELVSINLMARGLALNPMARFLHISYSDDLALLNSETAKSIIESEEYQQLWQLSIAKDAKAKKRWNVVRDGKKAGSVYAVSLGGQITGFRAGRMAEGFHGAIIIDDPLKPADATSKVKRLSANRSLINTVKSRKANPNTPIIVIMQRVAEEDPTGFIQQGGLGGEWEYVSIPAIIDDEYVAKLDEEYRDLVDSSVRDENGRFSYWEYKEPISELVEMEKGLGESDDGQKMSRHVFAGQYMQRPAPEGGDIIKGEWFGRYKLLPKLKWRAVYADTAQKTAEHNDFSVFLHAGLGVDGNIYILDIVRKKVDAVGLESMACDYYEKWRKFDKLEPVKLRYFSIEDKASGTGLIQQLKSRHKIPVKAQQRNTDKYSRVMDVQAHIQIGNVCIPEASSWVADFVTECESFTADDTHAHDDQVDTLVDCINDMLIKPRGMLDLL